METCAESTSHPINVARAWNGGTAWAGGMYRKGQPLALHSCPRECDPSYVDVASPGPYFIRRDLPLNPTTRQFFFFQITSSRMPFWTSPSPRPSKMEKIPLFYPSFSKLWVCRDVPPPRCYPSLSLGVCCDLPQCLSFGFPRTNGLSPGCDSLVNALVVHCPV